MGPILASIGRLQSRSAATERQSCAKVDVSVPCMPFDAASTPLCCLELRGRLTLAGQKVYKASEDLRCCTNPLYHWLLLVLSEIHSFKNVP